MEAWRVTAADWDRQQRYSEYLQAFEEMLELIDSEYAPWTMWKPPQNGSATKPR